MKTQNVTIQLAIFTMAWVLSVALSSFGPKFIWDGNQMLTIGSLCINILLAIVLILANRKFLQACDELQQKIQLEAMAIALGVTVYLGIAYSLFDITNVIHQDAEISYLVIASSISYMVALVVIRKQYQ